MEKIENIEIRVLKSKEKLETNNTSEIYGNFISSPVSNKYLCSLYTFNSGENEVSVIHRYANKNINDYTIAVRGKNSEEINYVFKSLEEKNKKGLIKMDGKKLEKRLTLLKMLENFTNSPKRIRDKKLALILEDSKIYT